MKGTLLRFKHVLIMQWIYTCASALLLLVDIVGGLWLSRSHETINFAVVPLFMIGALALLFGYNVWLLSIWMSCRLRNVKKGDLVLFSDGSKSEVISRDAFHFSVLPWMRGTGEVPTYRKDSGRRMYSGGSRAVCILPNRWKYKILYKQRDKEREI